jgi:hypothetical protein
MGNLVDDAARILASPMPRRQAVQALSRVLMGSLLAALGVRDSQGQASCRPPCSGGQQCCPGGDGDNDADDRGRGFCVGSSRTCCGSTSCAAGQTCCTGRNGQKFCIDAGRTCCGDDADDACRAGQTCCTGRGGRRFCSSSGGTCCGDTSCTSDQRCCTTGSQPFCGRSDATCCGNTSCVRGQTCCANTVCCGENQVCEGGRCRVSRT